MLLPLGSTTLVVDADDIGLLIIELGVSIFLNDPPIMMVLLQSYVFPIMEECESVESRPVSDLPFVIRINEFVADLGLYFLSMLFWST